MKWVLNTSGKIFNYFLFLTMNIIGNIGTIVPPILLGKMIDNFILYQDTNYVLRFGIITIVVLITTLGSAYFGFTMINYWRYDFSHKARILIYKKLNKLDQDFYNHNSLGDINTTITSDLYTVGFFVSGVLRNLIHIFLTFIIVLIYCLSINVTITLAMLIVTPFIIIITLNYNKIAEQIYEKRRAKRAELNNYITENIEGNKIVKAFSKEEDETIKCKILNNDLKDISIEKQKIDIKFDFKTSFLADFMNIILLLLGGYFVLEGTITLGNLIVFSSLIAYLKNPFSRLSSILSEYEDYKIGLKKIKGILSQEPKVENLGKKELILNKQDIKFKDVSVLFKDTLALQNINLTIKSGSTIACIGEVGSGKSTIAKLILRFVDPTKGNIYIGKENIKDFSLESLRNNIGYVSQTPLIFSDTIKNNVNYGNLELTDAEIIKYLKMAKADYALSLKEGINTIIGENGVNLSGGEKQRLSLARALAKEPKLLILDDITSALDVETEIEVTNNIKNLEYQCTKLIIAQKIFSVKEADVIFVFKDNKIFEYGTHKELLNKKGLYKEIYDLEEKS